MSPQLFIIHGSHTDNLGTDDIMVSLLSAPNLSKHSELVPLGNCKSGISLSEIETELPSLIKPDNTQINIIISMHGVVGKDDQYLIYTNGQLQSSNLLVNSLIKGTGGRALNLLFTSCFGANIQNNLALLPKGSKLISLSDKDQETQASDYFNMKAPEISELLAQYPFKFENLLAAYLLNQKLSFNTPIIGIHHNDGTLERKTMQDLAKQYLGRTELIQPSDLMQKLCEIYRISDIQIEHVKHSRDGTFEEFKSTHEKQYYFDGALQALRVTKVKFDKNKMPDPQKLYDADLNLFAHIEYYISEHNLLDSLEYKEFELLKNLLAMNNNHPDHAKFLKLYNRPEIQIIRYYKMIKYEVENISILKFDERLFTSYDNPDDEILPIVDLSIEIFQSALPVYSVCMGLALDQHLIASESN